MEVLQRFGFTDNCTAPPLLIMHYVSHYSKQARMTVRPLESAWFRPICIGIRTRLLLQCRRSQNAGMGADHHTPDMQRAHEKACGVLVNIKPPNVDRRSFQVWTAMLRIFLAGFPCCYVGAQERTPRQETKQSVVMRGRLQLFASMFQALSPKH